MKKFIFLALGLLTLFALWFYNRHPLGTKVTIGNQTFKAEVAITPAEKERGLGYRDQIAPKTGMLFVFDHKEKYSFWMKGMRFPLDFIWIDGNKIVDITTNVPPPIEGKQLVIYAPKIPVDKIFEINAGEVAESGIKIGDPVKITD